MIDADASGPVTPADHVHRSATEKAEWLWSEVISVGSDDPVDRPELAMVKPWTMLDVAARRNKLVQTLEFDGDLMPPSRPKIIHGQGAVAQVVYEPVEASSFTGVLAAPPEGGAIGFLRMSLAVPPKGRASFTPGFGLKLLVDGQRSLDVLAMNHTVGQGRDRNMFSNTFTHDLREEHDRLRRPQKMMKRFFSRVAVEPRWLSIDHLGEVTGRGERVEEPVVPGRLVFRPHRDVRRHFVGREQLDFREALALISVGAVLYDVEVAGAQTIGQLRLTRAFVASAGGDRLFFRHHTPSGNRIRS